MKEDKDSPSLLTTLRQRIAATTELPAMPGMAQALLRLSADPEGNINTLVNRVEQDPSLAAQLMRYARSAFFGFNGEINSLHHAVTAVLGYDKTIAIALGLSLGKSFSAPKYGPLGIYPFWRHAVYSAALCEALVPFIPPAQRPSTGLAFLCGLLHNFGVLLVAHLFSKETALLSQIIAANKDRPVIALERQVLGTDHTYSGGWLMQHWNLQPEIQIAVTQHHNPDYQGAHANYAHLVLIADRLLKRHDMGDAETTELPSQLLAAVGLSQADAEQTLTAIIDAGPNLDILARQLVA
jgi:HD-like signal output (HDOD) protein